MARRDSEHFSLSKCNRQSGQPKRENRSPELRGGQVKDIVYKRILVPKKTTPPTVMHDKEENLESIRTLEEKMREAFIMNRTKLTLRGNVQAITKKDVISLEALVKGKP